MAAHLRDHSTAVVCFAHKLWLTGFTVTLVVTYSETDSVKFSDANVMLESLFSGKYLRSF